MGAGRPGGVRPASVKERLFDGSGEQVPLRLIGTRGIGVGLTFLGHGVVQ